MTRTSAVWQVVQLWLDQQQFPPNQSKLAQALGVQRSAVSDWKSGKTHPSPENLRKLATLMEPTLGPRTYTGLVMAVTTDMGFGEWAGFKEVLDRLPEKAEMVFTGAHGYGEFHNLINESDVDDDDLSEPTDRPDLAIAADEQESSIAGEQEESDTP